MPTQAKSATTDSQRLFFGLALTDDARRLLHAACEQTSLPPQARPSLPKNYHMTLAFLGQVDSRRLPCVERAASYIQQGEFTLQLDRLGHWPQPQALWAAPSAPPEGLLKLVSSLQRQLLNCGFQPEQRRYQPHVTLARRLPHFDGPRELAAICWRARQFHLYHSVSTTNGVRYRPIRTWPLAAT